MSVGLPGDFLDADDLVTCFMGKPGRAGNIPRWRSAGLPRRSPFVDDDVGAVDFNLGTFKAKVFNIASNSNSEDDTVHRDAPRFSILIDRRRHRVGSLVEACSTS